MILAGESYDFHRLSDRECNFKCISAREPNQQRN